MKLDLHVHSCHSNDSNSKLIDIINKAVEKGLDGIAVTDHHTFAGSREALEVNPYPAFIIIPGSEYRTRYGHVQGLFIHGELELNENLRCPAGFWPFDAVVAEIHRQGGIAVMAHPFKNHAALPEEVWSGIDAVEVYNSRAVYSGRNSRANEQAAGLAAKYNLPVTAGSDGHWLGEIGRSYIELALDRSPGEKPTLDEVKEAILNKRVFVHGTGTPPWYQSLSQLVQLQKTGDYLRLPRVLAKLVTSALLFLFKQK
ncbi:PHP domain-containing protein [bacterium]|nr:MAG: PHP domain-containing protein [bacterium]